MKDAISHHLVLEWQEKYACGMRLLSHSETSRRVSARGLHSGGSVELSIL